MHKRAFDNPPFIQLVFFMDDLLTSLHAELQGGFLCVVGDEVQMVGHDGTKGILAVRMKRGVDDWMDGILEGILGNGL